MKMENTEYFNEMYGVSKKQLSDLYKKINTLDSKNQLAKNINIAIKDISQDKKVKNILCL